MKNTVVFLLILIAAVIFTGCSETSNTTSVLQSTPTVEAQKKRLLLQTKNFKHKSLERSRRSRKVLDVMP
jgi:uncharacterized lipoprotein YajG